MSEKGTGTEVVHASAIDDLCLRLLELREPGTLAKHDKELARYERDLARGGHKEVEIKEAYGSLISRTEDSLGYVIVGKDGQAQNVKRPMKPSPRAYLRMRYSRSSGYTDHARTLGLLAEPRFNRELRDDRVSQYAAEMKAGRWQDLLSGPLSVTSDGQVLNGQHRIAAASLVDWSEVANDPAFLVIWNVAPVEAHFADGSRRTPRDEKLIADRLLTNTHQR